MSRSTRVARGSWLVSELRRSLLAGLIAIPLTGITVGLGVRFAPGFADALSTNVATSLVSVVVSWTFIAMIHTVLTWHAFRTKDRDTFARAVAKRIPRRSQKTVTDWLLVGDEFSWPIMTSVVALITVCVLAFTPALRSVPFALAIGLAMVVVSWANVAMVFALNYARADLNRDALEFPGHAEATLSDYLYFAVGVQATFGATDVSVLNTSTRRMVTAQSVLAFIFNSVIVGMIISLLVGTL